MGNTQNNECPVSNKFITSIPKNFQKVNAYVDYFRRSKHLRDKADTRDLTVSFPSKIQTNNREESIFRAESIRTQRARVWTIHSRENERRPSARAVGSIEATRVSLSSSSVIFFPPPPTFIASETETVLLTTRFFFHRCHIGGHSRDAGHSDRLLRPYNQSLRLPLQTGKLTRLVNRRHVCPRWRIFQCLIFVLELRVLTLKLLIVNC